MKCSACKARLPAYQDGELSRGDQLLIAGHLASCSSCSAYHRELGAIDVMLERVSQINPSADFTLAVMAKIAALPAPAKGRPRTWWIGAYVAAAWAVLTVAFATRIVHWESVVAAAAGFAAKAGVAAQTLVRVADHLNLFTYAALGTGVELALLVAVAVVGRRYLTRLVAIPLGAYRHV